MEAVKWLSDNSFLWTTVGRGASPRKSILDRPDYKTAGPALGRARRLRRGHELRDRGRDPGRRRARLHDLFGRQLPRQDARGRVGRPGPSRRTRWRRSRSSGRRTSTPAEPAGLEASRGSALAHRGVGPAGRGIAGPRDRDRCGGRGSTGPATPSSPSSPSPSSLFNIAARPVRRLCQLHRVGHHRRRRLGRARQLHAPPSATSGCASPSSTSLLYALIIVPGVVRRSALAFALFVNQGWPLSGLARTLLFTPNVVSATVIGLVWVWVLDTQFGVLNHYLGYLGIGADPLADQHATGRWSASRSPRSGGTSGSPSCCCSPRCRTCRASSTRPPRSTAPAACATLLARDPAAPPARRSAWS